MEEEEEREEKNKDALLKDESDASLAQSRFQLSCKTDLGSGGTKFSRRKPAMCWSWTTTVEVLE